MSKLIVITGPSGVGKGTLIKSLLQNHPELYLSISATTRKPREGEINGKHYYFLSVNEFKEMVEAGELIEWAEYAGNFYGTPKSKVEDQLNQGRFVILEIELKGARQIKQTYPEALRVFILPPSNEELERRLRGRGTDAEEVIAKRLLQAQEEIAASNEFDIQIVNEDLEKTIVEVESALFGEKKHQALTIIS